MSQALETALLLLTLIVLALASFLRLEATLSERGMSLRVRWLGIGFWLNAPSARLELHWLGIGIYQGPLRSWGPRPKKPHPPEPHQRTSLSRVLSERPRVAWMGGYLLRHTHLERLELDATLATPDPALTGVLYGLIQAAQPLRSRWPWARIRVEPDFLGDVPRGRLELALRLRTLWLLLLGLQGLVLMRRLKGPRRQQGGRYGYQGFVERYGRGNAPGRQDRNGGRRAYRGGG